MFRLSAMEILKVLIVLVMVILLCGDITEMFACAERPRVPPGFEEQAARLLRHVRLPPERLADVPALLKDVKQALRTRWAESEVTPFGSTMAGLGIVGSDVDCFAQLPEPYSLSLVSEMQAVLERFPRTFHRPQAVLIARVPHVRFIHAPTGFQCDINCKNLLGVRKTALMKYYMELDERVAQVTVLVRYWAKLHKPSNSRRIMSNLAMVSLVIFYLQQIGKLPPVAELQKQAQRQIIEHWNTGFDEIPQCSASNVSLHEMLGGFFQYYEEFDFETMIVSTFAGHPIKRSDFDNVATVPNIFALYKKNVANGNTTPLNIMSPILIQDPFLHNDNLATINKEVLAKFKQDIKFASKAYTRCKDDFLGLILEESSDDDARENLMPLTAVKCLQEIVI